LRNFHHSRNVSLDKRVEAHLESKPEFPTKFGILRHSFSRKWLGVTSAAGDLIHWVYEGPQEGSR
jgi:hypothetical protein